MDPTGATSGDCRVLRGGSIFTTTTSATRAHMRVPASSPPEVNAFTSGGETHPTSRRAGGADDVRARAERLSAGPRGVAAGNLRSRAWVHHRAAMPRHATAPVGRAAALVAALLLASPLAWAQRRRAAGAAKDSPVVRVLREIERSWRSGRYDHATRARGTSSRGTSPRGFAPA
jgi:hypothetical protein